MFAHLKALCKNQKGSAELTQFILILPVMVAILYGSYELMRIASIRQTLEAATAQAAQYLSQYHKTYTFDDVRPAEVDARAQAERIIWESLLANEYLSRDTRMQVVVRYFNFYGQPIAPPVEFNCRGIQTAVQNPRSSNLFFTVRAWVTLPWKTWLFDLPVGNVTLGAAHSTFVDCGPWDSYVPPPTPMPTPTP